jgi:hypothetical protein
MMRTKGLCLAVASTVPLLYHIGKFNFAKALKRLDFPYWHENLPLNAFAQHCIVFNRGFLTSERLTSRPDC